MIKVAMHPLTLNGVGSRIGYVQLQDTPGGLRITPDLYGLQRFGIQPGAHGFHIHEVGNLDPATKKGKVVAGGAAGEHYDPDQTGRHAGPYGSGHRGDLPVLVVAANGSATRPVIAPRLTLDEVMGRAIIIHAGGDNYTDNPPNGGGRSRVIGGIITNDCPYCKKGNNMNSLVALGGVMAAFSAVAYYFGQQSSANTTCPEPTRDIGLNTKNRQLAIDKYDYGPPNPQKPSLPFWKRLAKRWKRKPTRQAIEEVKSMRCGNCVAFDISPRMEACMPGPVSKAGKLGYCWMHDFKCASLRTCATWAGGGPITEDKVSLDWQRRKDRS